MVHSIMESVLWDGCTEITAAHWVDRETGQILQTDTANGHSRRWYEVLYCTVSSCNAVWAVHAILSAVI